MRESFEDIIQGVLSKVDLAEKTAADVEVSVEETSTQNEVLNTVLSSSLIKTAAICRELKSSNKAVSYKDMQAYWRNA